MRLYKILSLHFAQTPYILPGQLLPLYKIAEIQLLQYYSAALIAAQLSSDLFRYERQGNYLTPLSPGRGNSCWCLITDQ